MKIGDARSARLFRYLIAPAALAGAVLLATGPATWAQGTAPASQEPRIIDDREHGEGDRIERRQEWFYSSRRAGTDSAAEMAQLRLAGVEATRRALTLQSERRAAAGYETVGQNFWFSKGPSPSNFGGWSFGTVAGRGIKAWHSFNIVPENIRTSGQNCLQSRQLPLQIRNQQFNKGLRTQFANGLYG